MILSALTHNTAIPLALTHSYCDPIGAAGAMDHWPDEAVFEIFGSGDKDVNGFYKRIGDDNGKPQYTRLPAHDGAYGMAIMYYDGYEYSVSRMAEGETGFETVEDNADPLSPTTTWKARVGGQNPPTIRTREQVGLRGH